MAQCDNCGTEHAVHLLIRYDKDGNRTESCDNCANLSRPTVHDAYLGKVGIHQEENLADPKTGEPIPFSTKAEKAAIMRKLGVREAGDRVHGARNEVKRRIYG